MAVPPYGGNGLTRRLVTPAEFAERTAVADNSLRLNHAERIHLANMATGAYSPLTGFMDRNDYDSVVADNRLASGLDWPLPITLAINAEERPGVTAGQDVILEDDAGTPLALMTVADIFEATLPDDCRRIFGTTDPAHPGVAQFLGQPPYRAGGTVFATPEAAITGRHTHSPEKLRQILVDTGGRPAVAFSTRNICHLGHDQLGAKALAGTNLLGVNVITGAEFPGSYDPDFIFDSYEYLIEVRGLSDRVFLNNLRLPSLRAGPREAFLQAVMLQNMGFSQFIVGRDHAGVGGFYGPYAAQEYFHQGQDLAIEILKAPIQFYCRACGATTNSADCGHGEAFITHFRGTELRQMLSDGSLDQLGQILPADLYEFVARRSRERERGVGDKIFTGD